MVAVAVVSRAGRRDRAAEATRRRILAVVEQLLAGGGTAAVSIREICVRAAVTPPTIYHHFGDKQALIERVVSDCFLAFDRTLSRRRVPKDPVEVLRAGFDRYVAYGLEHPSHYRVMFQHPARTPTAAGLESYNKLRAAVAAIAAAGQLRVPVDQATFAFWSAAHGITSLLVDGVGRKDDPSVALVRDALINGITIPQSKQVKTRGKGVRS